LNPCCTVGAIPLACCRDKLCFYNCNNSGTRSSVNPLFFSKLADAFAYKI
jgi:hypothetical protein